MLKRNPEKKVSSKKKTYLLKTQAYVDVSTMVKAESFDEALDIASKYEIAKPGDKDLDAWNVDGEYSVIMSDIEHSCQCDGCGNIAKNRVGDIYLCDSCLGDAARHVIGVVKKESGKVDAMNCYVCGKQRAYYFLYGEPCCSECNGKMAEHLAQEVRKSEDKNKRPLNYRQ